MQTDLTSAATGRVRPIVPSRPRDAARRHNDASLPGRVSNGARAGLTTALAVCLVVAHLIVAPSAVSTSHPAARSAGGQRGADATRAALTAEILTATAGMARITTDPVSRLVSFIGGTAEHPLAPASATDPTVTAETFVDHFGALFGATGVRATDGTALASGGNTVRFQQQVAGIPVIAGQLVVRLAADGSVLAMTGEVSQSALLPTTAAWTPGQASAGARTVAARVAGEDTSEIRADAPTLAVFDPTLIGATSGTRLVWQVGVHDVDGDVDGSVLVDATDGHIVLDLSGASGARSRRVCDDAGNATNPETCASNSPLVRRTEGQAPLANGTPGAADVNMAYDLAGVTYDFYMNVLGRDSVDGAGMPMVSTVRYCISPSAADCPYPAATWTGTQMVYGSGWANADDIVGHEFTHGVTERTSKLMHYGESGAIDESISDVMGELIDQSSTVSGADPPSDLWKIGEQLPGGAIRNMSDPGALYDPDRMTSPRYAGSAQDDHSVHTNSAVGDKAAYLIAAGTSGETNGVFNGQVISGIGNTKTAKIFYEAEVGLLGPGSDYADLYDILPQACTDLVGTASITPTDCAQVRKAVVVTEMNLAPISTGSRLTAPLCTTGQVVMNQLFSDDMENSSLPKWTRPVPSDTAGQWVSSTDAASSGTRSLHGPNTGGALTAEASMASSVRLTPGATTYLHFSHSFAMEADIEDAPAHYYDGGVVEYSTNSGASWFDAGTLSGTVNGYTAALYASNGNPLAGRQAYSATSPGFEETRIDVSSLAGTGPGNTLQIRFKVGTDSLTGLTGWFVDDVSIYTCAAPTVAGAPTAVSATPHHASATVHWTPPSSNGGAAITSYRVTPYIGAAAQTVVTTTDASTFADVPGLVDNTAYTFKVAAVNSVGIGPMSAASTVIYPSAQAPDAPTGVGASRGDQGATVTWTPPASNGGSAIVKYRVHAYTGTNELTAETTNGVAPGTSPTFFFPGLVNGTTYTFRVQAVNSTAAPDGELSAATAGVVPAGLPSPPTGLNATSGQLSATVTWTPPTSTNGTPITGYVVTPFVGATAQTPTATGTTDTTFTATGLSYGTSYTFRVATVTSIGTGAASASSNAITPSADLPGSPTLVTATRGDRYAAVSWTAPISDGGATILRYDITPYLGPVAQASTSTTSSSTSFAVQGLTNGLSYTFRVAAVNDSGAGSPSSASAAVVPAGPPQPATGVVAFTGDRSASLTWSAPVDQNGSSVTGYVVTPYLGAVAQTSIATSTTVPFTVTGLANGQTYSFTVAATNAAGTGAASTRSNSIVPVGAPSAPTAVVGTSGDGTVSLGWTPPVDNGGRPISNYVITPFVGGVARTPTVTPTSATTFGLSGMSNGTQYTFHIAAVNAVGTGPQSTEVAVLTPAGSPSAPTGVAALAGNGSALVSWTPPASDGGAPITGYVVTAFANGVPVATADASASAVTLVVPGLDPHGLYTFNVTAKNGTGLGTPSAQTAAMQPFKAGFTAVGPDRVFDTRPGESPGALRQVPKVQVGGANVLEVKMTDLAGLVPASGVGAVSLNVVATGAAAGGFVTVFPCGERKLVASVNFGAGQTVANAVVAPVSATGSVCFYSLSATDLVVDINGWFAADSGFAAVGPDRVFDTRPGESPLSRRDVAKAKVGGANVLEVNMTGIDGLVPSTNVAAVSINVAVTNPAAAGFVTVFPCGERKLVASVNFLAGQTVANAVIAPVSAAGSVCFFSLVPTDLIVDINGWFAVGSDFTAVGPDRVFDTRPGESPPARRDVAKAKVGGANVLEVNVLGMSGLTPGTDVGAVSINVAVTNPDGPGFVTVFPCGERKLVASVNYAAGQTVANAVIAPVSATGTVCFYSLAPTDLIVDINGWFPTAG